VEKSRERPLWLASLDGMQEVVGSNPGGAKSGGIICKYMPYFSLSYDAYSCGFVASFCII